VNLAVDRAFQYPYQSLDFSHFIAGNHAYPLLRYERENIGKSLVLSENRKSRIGDVVSDLALSDEPRFPLIAYGANASFDGLARKFRDSGEEDDSALPVLRGSIRGIDVGFSPHFSSYGALPATLVSAPSVDLRVSILMVTQDQFDLLAKTEVNYHYGWLSSTEFSCSAGSMREDLYAFISRHGALEIEGAVTSLASVEASGRQTPSMTEEEVLEAVSEKLGEPDAQTLVTKVVTNYVWAIDMAPELRTSYEPFDHPDWVYAFKQG
jgi:hypothetical protein